MRAGWRRTTFATLLSLAGCASYPTSGTEGLGPALITKPISFAILEDYDKGQDLEQIGRDFAIMRQLGFDTLRCSFGWDDFEPSPGAYDFVWLRDFVALAGRNGIKLRPYIGYTPAWAGIEGTDEQDWNDPPADQQRWYEFVRRLAGELQAHQNVLSYEIYNEQNAPFWWDGSVEQYLETLQTASRAIRSVDKDAQIILGGFVFPDENWLGHIVQNRGARYYDIAAFHAYPETWTESGVTAENYLDEQYVRFVQLNRSPGEGEPIWINEMGFATTEGVSETEQANWFVRAISTYLADPYIQHIGVYELRDLNPQSAALGDARNYHLGLLRVDGTPKLAFKTVDLLTALLDSGTLTVADKQADVSVVSGQAGEMHHHLFLRPDRRQVLFIWDKSAETTVTVKLATRGRAAFRYALAGDRQSYPLHEGRALRNIALTPGEVGIFLIEP